MPETASDPVPRPTPPKITRGEWALILVLVAIQFTHMVDFVIIMPLGARLMAELDITPVEFGWIVSVYAIAAGVASFLGSLVMDRFDRRSVLIAMYGGFTLSTLLCGLAETYVWLLVARTLAGIFGGLAAVSIMAVIGDVFPAEKRGRATGAITSSFAVASIVGLPIGLVLADKFGRGAPFVALAGLSTLVWVFALFRLPQVRGHLEHARRNAILEMVAVLREPNHQRAFLFTFFMVLGTFTVASFMAPYMAATNGWTEDQLATLYFAGGVCTLFGMGFIGRMADRFPRLMLFRILAGMTIVATLAVTNLPPGPLWVAAAALSLFMVFAAGRMVPAQAMLLGAAQPRVRGAFMSLNTAVQHLGTGIAPILAGALITKSEDGTMTGFPVVGLVASVLTIISLVLAGLVRPAKVIAPVAVPEAVAAPKGVVEPVVAV
ncbi:MAG: MFS transporter [Planctomycetaceae bacterium]|nr:MFS transporter [Planctomycetaceae bacterium]